MSDTNSCMRVHVRCQMSGLVIIFCYTLAQLQQHFYHKSVAGLMLMLVWDCQCIASCYLPNPNFVSEHIKIVFNQEYVLVTFTFSLFSLTFRPCIFLVRVVYVIHCQSPAQDSA